MKSNTQLLEEFNRRVYGHEEAKKALITLVSRSKMRHYQKYALNIDNDELLEPSKILLIGESGTGKSFLVQELQKITDFPLLMLDATQLSPSGSTDGCTQSKLQQKIVSNAENWVKNRAEIGYTHSLAGAISQTVVFIDEIDKLARSFDSSGNWNKHVQSNFLTLIGQSGEFASSGISFIFAGAFAGMKRIKGKTGGLGFNSEFEYTESLLDADIIEYGLIPELIGRLTAIVEVDVFNEESYKYIMNNILIPKK